MKKAVFFDIDGTLWGGDCVIPQSAVDAIRALQANGHYAFLCSGRTKAFIRDPHLLAIGFDGIVSGCGTMVEFRGESLVKEFINPDLMVRTMDVLRSCRMRTILEGDRYLYMDPEDFIGDPYADMVLASMGEDCLTIRDHYGKWEVVKFSCATEDADEERCYRELDPWFRFLIHDGPVTECVPHGFDKRTGMEVLCRHLDIPMEDSIAFGDSANDYDMIEAAGIGICMGNGQTKIRALADYVTDPYYEDGIRNALLHLGLI